MGEFPFLSRHRALPLRGATSRLATSTGWWRLGMGGLLAFCASSAIAQGQDPSRGQLLYSNHCIECHTTQMHWRDQRLARDWETLKGQVRRWQGVAHLGWSEEDIEAVTRHLNDTIYRFPRAQSVGQATPQSPTR